MQSKFTEILGLFLKNKGHVFLAAVVTGRITVNAELPPIVATMQIATEANQNEILRRLMVHIGRFPDG